MTYRHRLSVAIIVVLGSWSIAGTPALRAGAAPVYGEDGREEVLNHPDQRLRTIANSVAALVPARRVRTRGNNVTFGGGTLDERVRRICGGPMCDGGRFRSQPTPAFCTGFLVGPDLLVTAGHCIDNERVCQRTRFVFDFKTDATGAVAPTDRNDVFECESLVQSVERRSTDFAVVRLDRDTGRLGLLMQIRDDIAVGAPLALIGHPLGLPIKIAAGGMVVNSRPGRSVFEATVDALDSSSGSPVINTDTYRVEGLLTAGDQDFVETPEGCFILKRCPDDGSACQLEDVVRMSAIYGPRARSPE